MAKATPEEKQQRRAQEDLATALKRANGELAVDMLLKLHEPRRTEGLPAVAALFRSAVQRAFGTAQWSLLFFWAMRVEREERLLLDGDPAQQAELRWALLWGCARSSEWTRARALLSALQAHLAPPLFAALDALVAAKGAPSLEAFPIPPEPTPPGPDPRLGYDNSQRAAQAVHPEVAAPRQLEDVEPRLLAAFGVLQFGDFARTVAAWAASSALLAAPIWELAAKLSTGAMLERAPGGAEQMLGPARLLAQCLSALGAPSRLEAEATVALRLASAGGSVGTLFGVVAPVAARYASLLPLVESVIAAIERKGAPCSDLLIVIERVLEESPSAPLCLAGVALWRTKLLAEHLTPAAPAFLVRGLEKVLDREGDFARAAAMLPEKTVRADLQALAVWLPPELVQRAIDQAWAAVDDGLRQIFASCVEILLENAALDATPLSKESSARADARLVELAIVRGLPLTPGSMARLEQSPEGRLIVREMARSEYDPFAPLPEAARPLWEAFRERLVPMEVFFLELGLGNARTKEEGKQALDAYFKGRTTGQDLVQCLLDADKEACDRVFQLSAKTLRTAKVERDTLARGLLDALRLGAGYQLRTLLASELLAADGATAAPRTAQVEMALVEARILSRGRRKPGRKGAAPKAKAPRKAKAAAKRKAKPKAGAAPESPSARQLDLAQLGPVPSVSGRVT